MGRFTFVVVALLIFVFYLMAYAADAPKPATCPPDQTREILRLQQQNAQLLYENAAMKLKLLDSQQTEKPEAPKK